MTACKAPNLSAASFFTVDLWIGGAGHRSLPSLIYSQQCTCEGEGPKAGIATMAYEGRYATVTSTTTITTAAAAVVFFFG